MNKIIFREQEVSSVIDGMSSLLEGVSIVSLSGPLGAGKTTLVRGFLARLGVEEKNISSPTFSYVHMYRLHSGREVFHFDLYRLTSIDDFYALGFDEYIYRPNSISFVEWPEIIMPLLSHRLLFITLDYGETSETRSIFWRRV